MLDYILTKLMDYLLIQGNIKYIYLSIMILGILRCLYMMIKMVLPKRKRR